MEGTTVSTGRSTSAARAGSTSTGAGSSIPKACRRSAGSSVMPRSSTRSRSTPASTALPLGVDLRGLAREGAAGLPLRGQGQPLHHPHEEAARLRGASSTASSTLARPLGRQARPLLYQLPPSLHKNLERLESLPRAAARATSSSVFEFRHKSWYDEDVLALLDRHGVGFVAHDLQGLGFAALGERPHRLRPLPRRRAANIGAAIRTRRCSSWTDWSLEQAATGRSASGAISTTTSTATRSRTRGR